MNAIADVAAPVHGSMSDPPPSPVLFTLRRTGRKAVKFNGWRIIEAAGAGDTAPMWYDLGLYRSDAGKVIAELVARRGPMDEQDLCRVEIFDGLSEAVSWLEDYECARDVPVPAILLDEDAPMATAALYAVQLRQRVACISEEFQSLLSDVFEALGVTDSNSGQAE